MTDQPNRPTVGDLYRAQEQINAAHTTPRLEVLIVRDPDGGTDLTLFLDGHPLTWDEYTSETVDAGAGYERADWNETTRYIREATSYTPAFKAAVLTARADPPGSQYIDGDLIDDHPFVNKEGWADYCAAEDCGYTKAEHQYLAYDHPARPDDLPEPGDRCKDCGEEITWMGPSQYDWLHVDEEGA